MHPRFAWAGLALIGFALLMAGCGTSSQNYSVGRIEHGYGSWYGSENGRTTASGERFDPHQLTAAHRHFPFGTIVRVTNEQNGKSVEVRINDRGPWTHGRIIDVSSAAADELDMKRAGIVPVTLEIVQPAAP